MMTQAQVIWAIIAVTMAIANAPFLISLLSPKGPNVIIPSFQASIDELNALATSVAALKAAADSASNAVSPQDLSDTLNAVEQGVNAVKAASGQ